MNISDRVPPQAVDVERAVLGAMILYPGICEHAARVLLDECFYVTEHKQIFLCLRDMNYSGMPVDIVTLAESLRQKGILDAIGSESYLAELLETVAVSTNIKRHIEILFEKAVLRGVISTFSNGVEFSFSPDATPEKVLYAAEKRILQYRKKMQKISGIEVYEHEKAVSAFVEDISTPLPDQLAGLPWPVEGMNKITGGALRGKTCVLSGYTKGGKSRFMRCCVSNWLNRGYSGVYVLTEEDVPSVLRCIFASRCKVDTKDMFFHICTDFELDRIRQEQAVLSGQNLFIERQIGASPGFVEEVIDRAGNEMIKRGGKLDFCILDTCSKMEKPGYDDNLAKMHADMAEDLLRIADETGVAMVEVMQYLSETERGSRTKKALHSMMRFGQYYLESANTSISFDDRRKNKKEIELERKRGYKVVKAHIVQREGESFGYVDTKAELKYSHYSDPTGDEVDENNEDEKQVDFFDGTAESTKTDRDLPF